MARELIETINGWKCPNCDWEEELKEFFFADCCSCGLAFQDTTTSEESRNRIFKKYGINKKSKNSFKKLSGKIQINRSVKIQILRNTK